MRIISLNKKDVAAIIELDKASFVNYDLPAITKKEIEHILSKGFILGIKENKKLVSNIHVFEKEKNKWLIHGIATLPEKQGKGLADILLKELIKKARKNKIEEIIASIRPGNEKSISLFEKNNFKEKEFVKDYHGRGKHRLLFAYYFR